MDNDLGIFLCASSKESALQWVNTLRFPSSTGSFLDASIEREAAQAMLESYPIIKGETAKIDLERKKYEELTTLSKTRTGVRVAIGKLTNGLIEEDNSETEKTNSSINSNQEKIISSDVGKSDTNQILESSMQDDESLRLTPIKSDEYGISVIEEVDQLNIDLDTDSEDELLENILKKRNSSGAMNHVNYDRSKQDRYKEDESSNLDDDDGNSSVPDESSSITGESSRNRRKESHARSNSHRKNSIERERSDSNSVPNSRSLYGFGSAYKKDSDTWVRLGSDSNSGKAFLGVASFEGSKEIHPKSIIPKVDPTIPLAKRHGYMISQCE